MEAGALRATQRGHVNSAREEAERWPWGPGASTGPGCHPACARPRPGLGLTPPKLSPEASLGGAVETESKRDEGAKPQPGAGVGLTPPSGGYASLSTSCCCGGRAEPAQMDLAAAPAEAR